MADRYWIFRAGIWNTTNTINWSVVPGFSFTGSCSGTTLQVLGGGPVLPVGFTVRTTAGSLIGTVTGGTYPTYTVTPGGTFGTQLMDAGGQGAAVPTLADSVFFQSTASFTVTTTGALNCLDLTVSAGVHTFATGTSPTLSIYGSMTLVSGTVWTTTASKTFRATSTGKTITTNGTQLNGSVTFSGVGGAWTLGSALTVNALTSWANGTFSDGGYSLTTVTANSVVTTTRSVDITSTWLVTGGGSLCWNFSGTPGLSVTGNGTVSLTSASPKTFNGSGASHATITLNQGGSGELTISGATTLFNITNTVQPATVIFPASTTTTVSNFNLTGTVGSLITITSSSAGLAATLSKASGTVTVNYLSIKDSTATGGASWNAVNSTNVSGNTGWNFGGVIAAVSTFLLMFI